MGCTISKQLKIKLTDAEHRRFKLYCVERDLSMGEVMRSLIANTVTNDTPTPQEQTMSTDTPESKQAQAVKDIQLAWETQPETVRAFHNSPTEAYYSLARQQGFETLPLPTVIEEMEPDSTQQT